MRFKDQLQRTVTFPKIPSRIVSLVPSQTELLIDLGLRDKLVGITKFCVHPENLRDEIAVVGGTKKVNYKKIIALKPDLIICNKEENTLEMVQKLEEISKVWVTDIFSIEDNLQMITSFGKIFNINEKAASLISKINFEKDSFLEFMKDKPYKNVMYLIWKNPYMAAGSDTFINELLQLNHFENHLPDENARYPEIELDNLKGLDLLLLSTEPYPFKIGHAVEMATELGIEVKLVDGEFFSWYGSRLTKAFTYFRTLH